MKDKYFSMPSCTLHSALGLAIVLLCSFCLNVQAQKIETMFSVYEQNRDKGRGNYITEDFVLLSHSLMMSETIADVEEEVLAPQIAHFAKEMVDILGMVEKDHTITEANLSYFILLEALLVEDAKAKLDDDLAKQELALILTAKGIATSPLMGHQIDYSRFKPRGRYARSKEMENWFRAMTWAGSAYFPVLESKATGITKIMADDLTARALEITTVINENETLVKRYELIDNLLKMVFGGVEDLTWKDYASFDLEQKTGKSLSEKRQGLYAAAQKSDKIPVIYDGIVLVDQLEKGRTAGDVLCGLRLFPRRYSPESAAMQKMVFPDAGKYIGKEKTVLPFTVTSAGGELVKGFPRALELMWMLGSELSGDRLVQAGDDQYDGYSETVEKSRKELRNKSTLAINTSLIRYWLNSGKQDKERKLTSMLGYWTYGRYISLLFTKQSVTGAVKSIQIPKRRENAWLEPATELYLWLKDDMQSLRKSIGDVDEIIGSRLDKYLGLLEQIISISDLENAGYTLGKGEIDFLNNLDREVLYLTEKKDTPIIVDVHTDPGSKKVLQEAIGFAQEIEHSIGDVVLKGALFTHFEFKHDMSDRLNDESWVKMLLESCPEYFTGMEKVLNRNIYKKACEDGILPVKIFVTLSQPPSEGVSEENYKGLVKASVDKIVARKIKGLEVQVVLKNSAQFSATATASAIRELAAHEDVLAIEENQKLNVMTGFIYGAGENNE